jgi:hypothetical protein
MVVEELPMVLLRWLVVTWKAAEAQTVAQVVGAVKHTCYALLQACVAALQSPMRLPRES